MKRKNEGGLEPMITSEPPRNNRESSKIGVRVEEVLLKYANTSACL